MGKPFIILRNFLGDKVRAQLLDYVLASQQAFGNSHVWNDTTSASTLNDKARRSKVLDDFGDLQDLFDQQVISHVPSLIRELGLTAFEPSGIESEIIAHNDGDFFRRHIDTFSGKNRSPEGHNRLITLVYYFYREPRAFSGGELCIYPLSLMNAAAASDESITSFAIEQDTAIAFSSILPHEVLKVACPSNAFADSRFSINTWVLRAR